MEKSQNVIIEYTTFRRVHGHSTHLAGRVHRRGYNTGIIHATIIIIHANTNPTDEVPSQFTMYVAFMHAHAKFLHTQLPDHSRVCTPHEYEQTNIDAFEGLIAPLNIWPHAFKHADKILHVCQLFWV